MSASLYAGWSAGQLPLKSVLGTPEVCLEAALAMARRAETLGDLSLAETLLRGVVALDARSVVAATALARVLLARAIGRGDPRLTREASAWCDYALELTPGDAELTTLATRCRRTLGAT